MGRQEPESISRGGLVVAAFIAIFGFLPIVNWIPLGFDLPSYSNQVAEWVSGSALALGSGIVLTVLAKHLALALARTRRAASGLSG